MRIHEIDRSRLLPHDKAFNPSICRWKDKVLMAYRVEYSGNDSWAKLAICELDEDWQPIQKTNQYLDIPKPYPHTDLFEDPRLYSWKDKELLLSFISATLSPNGHVAIQGFTELFEYDGKFQVGFVHYPDCGHNRNYAFDGRLVYNSEKNWTHTWRGIIYSIDPLIFCDNAYRSSKINHEWKHGRISGSTQLIPYGENLIGMFHSFVYDFSALPRRHYVVGWYVIDSKNWKMVAISKEPFLIARDGPEDLRPASQPWKPNVVFPCGLMDLGDEFAVSYGWQDSRCRIAFCSKKEVEHNLIPVTKHFVEKYVLNDPYQGLQGGFKCTIGDKVIQGKTWPRIRAEGHRLGIPELDLSVEMAKGVPSSLKRKAWVSE